MITLSASNKVDEKKLILTQVLGMTLGLKEGAISLDDAEILLFTPYSMIELEKQGIGADIIDPIHLGTELEDVLSLIPDQWESTLDLIIEKALKLLAELPASGRDSKKWIDKRHKGK